MFELWHILYPQLQLCLCVFWIVIKKDNEMWSIRAQQYLVLSIYLTVSFASMRSKAHASYVPLSICVQQQNLFLNTDFPAFHTLHCSHYMEVSKVGTIPSISLGMPATLTRKQAEQVLFVKIYVHMGCNLWGEVLEQLGSLYVCWL